MSKYSMIFARKQYNGNKASLCMQAEMERAYVVMALNI
jgi:hypothetical protein